MKMLRNPEIKREFIIYAVITLILAVIGLVFSPICGILALLLGAILCLVHLYFARRRYAEMERLSQSIDRILHGQEGELIDEAEEGELSILTSEVRKMTVRLREQAGLLTADKLRLTEAIQDIFHQIRTPLTGMNLAVSLLGEEALSYERRLELTRELRRQLERTRWLVETLLKLSKIDAGTAQFRRDSVSVRELCQRAAEPFLIPLELRGQTLEFSVSDEHFTGDLSWTAEALGNMLKNSMEHTPEAGKIRIEAAETALYTEITVTDSGEGFAREDLPHIFERFYKGKNASPGSIGIGLALARSIITAQNGTVTAQNLPEGGARFTVKFYKIVV